MTHNNQIEKLLRQLTPDQQNFAKAVATMQLENKMLTTSLADLKEQHDHLWRIMLVILNVQPGKELRIHESQFLRFKEEYRIDRTFDKETDEVVVRLMTVFDEVAGGGE